MRIRILPILLLMLMAAPGCRSGMERTWRFDLLAFEELGNVALSMKNQDKIDLPAAVAFDKHMLTAAEWHALCEENIDRGDWLGFNRSRAQFLKHKDLMGKALAGGRRARLSINDVP